MNVSLRAVARAALVVALLVPLAEAGAVKAKLRKGVLTVSGNCEANQLSVFPVYAVPTIELTGGYDSLAVFDGVNSLGVFPLDEISKVVIKAKGQTDDVFVAMVDFIDLCVTTGCNSDRVFVSGCIGELEILTGDRHDTVCLTHAYVQGSTTIKTGCGKDVVILGGYCPCGDEEGEGENELRGLGPVDGAPTASVTFCDDVSVLMGDGRDELYVFSAWFGCDVEGLADLVELESAPLADIFGIKVRLHGGCGKDCRTFLSSNIPLDDYAKSFELDCLAPPQ